MGKKKKLRGERWGKGDSGLRVRMVARMCSEICALNNSANLHIYPSKLIMAEVSVFLCSVILTQVYVEISMHVHICIRWLSGFRMIGCPGQVASASLTLCYQQCHPQDQRGSKQHHSVIYASQHTTIETTNNTKQKQKQMLFKVEV